MLILCYGMPKSGSAFIFELVREMLHSAGFEQNAIINDEHDSKAADAGRLGPRNFARNITEDKLAGLLAAAGPDQKIAVKMHSRMLPGMFQPLEDLQKSGQLRVIASYRDPRQMCLSRLDASMKTRKKAAGPAIDDADLLNAAKDVERRILHFREWGALNGTLRLDYDSVAALPADATDRIEATLGIVSDRAAVKQNAFRTAYLPRASKHKVNDAQAADLLARFSTFLHRVCDLDDQGWFDEIRDGLLSTQLSSTGS